MADTKNKQSKKAEEAQDSLPKDEVQVSGPLEAARTLEISEGKARTDDPAQGTINKRIDDSKEVLGEKPQDLKKEREEAVRKDRERAEDENQERLQNLGDAAIEREKDMERAEDSDTSFEEIDAKKRAKLEKRAEGGNENAKTELAEKQALDNDGQAEGPVALYAASVPHTDQSAVTLMTRPEGGSMESRAFGTSAPSATSGAAAARLTEIADAFDTMRAIDLGLAIANDNSSAAFRAYLGQYQVRSGEGLALPNRAPDVTTLHGEWWMEGDEHSGVFVGHPVGVDGLVFRLPRTTASFPGITRVLWTSAEKELEAQEARSVSEDFRTPAPVDTGLEPSVRPEAALSPHIHPFEGYDNSRATLGGFTGQAIAIPGNRQSEVANEEATRERALFHNNVQRHVELDEQAGYTNETEKAQAEGARRNLRVNSGMRATDPENDPAAGEQDGPSGFEQEDAEQRRRVSRTPDAEANKVD